MHFHRLAGRHFSIADRFSPAFPPIFPALSQPRLEWQFVMSTEARCRSAHRVSCSPHNTLEINSPELAKIVYKIIVTH